MLPLETAWFLLVGVLLAGYAILDGFDLGVGMLHTCVAKDDTERRTVINAIAPVWDGNEVWLLLGGGAIFAAFPKVYATVFSGFYVALMLLLAALIVRAVCLEFRSKLPDSRWRTTWDWAFVVSSFLPSLLFGVALGNILHGVPLDADLIFDTRFLPNPFYVDALRGRTGSSKDVRDYVLRSPETREFLARLTDFLGYLLPKFVAEGKSYLTIAVGCTGGRHRSVVLAEELGGFLRKARYDIKVLHRDMIKSGLT